MKLTLYISALAALLCTTPAQAQTDGSISPDVLKAIAQKGGLTKADAAISHALKSNTLAALAKSYGNDVTVDTHFSVETKQQTITDQKSSGRCWMFSSFNALRSAFAVRTDSLRVDFSEAYLFFWDQLEKSNLFLQGIIETASKPMEDPLVRFLLKNPIGDGGTYGGMAELANKYGLVPQCVMPETSYTNSTSAIGKVITTKLRQTALVLRDMAAAKKSKKDIAAAKQNALADIYHILCLAIGCPPTEFTYAHVNKDGKRVTAEKRYTPQSFYEEVSGGEKTADMVMIMNDPRRPYYKTYEVEYCRHTWDGSNWCYVNLPMDEIEAIAIASLRDGRKMYSSYDVGKYLDRTCGYASLDNYDYETILATDLKMDKAQRIATFDSGSTHAMTLTAVDLDAEGKATKWKVENSWGASWGQKGCLIMTDEWIREYMYRLVVNRKYVPETVLKALAEKPTLVPYNDPLFAEDE